MMKMKLVMTLSAALVLAACTTVFESKKVDYQSQGKQGPGLDVPPDLSQLTSNTQAAVPLGGAINASAYKTGNPSAVSEAGAIGTSAPTTAVPTVAVNAIGSMHIQREGTQRWLVVDNRPPEKLWDDIKSFWGDNGFTLTMIEPKLGIMETDWNENRSKLPQDGIRKYLGGILGGLYSTNQRDKFRTRLERTASGGTEIYISHHGLVEDFVTADHSKIEWVPSPVDPELEIEFLNRLLNRLSGVPADTKVVASASTAAPAATATSGAATETIVNEGRARLVQEGEQTSILVNDAFDQAWRRIGLSLDRTSFTVEDRDRSKGIYFVRYVDPDAEKNAPGFFAKLFGAKEKNSLQKYQIVVTGEADRTRIKVANLAGQVLNTADAKNILKVLLTDLK